MTNRFEMYRSGLTVQEGDQIGKVHSADHGEVTGVRLLKQALLLVHGCLSVSNLCPCCHACRNIRGLAVTSFAVSTEEALTLRDIVN